jgi:hypothetical protein
LPHCIGVGWQKNQPSNAFFALGRDVIFLPQYPLSKQAFSCKKITLTSAAILNPCHALYARYFTPLMDLYHP